MRLIRLSSLYIRRAVALFLVRSLEIRLHDQISALQVVTDRDVRDQITAALRVTRRELAAARANYIALLPPGTRRTWAFA